MAFVVVISIFSTIIDMPFVIYYTFWLEERHGFNKQVYTVFNTMKVLLTYQILCFRPLHSLSRIPLRN